MGSTARRPRSGASSPLLVPSVGGMFSSAMSLRQVVGRGRASDVDEADVLGVGLDEVLAHLDVLAHQDGEHLVGQGRLLDVDLQQRAGGRVHRRDPQLLVVHLAQALQAGEVLLVVRSIGEEPVLGRVVLEVHLFLADLGGVERRLADVDVALLDQRLHLAEEERQQQRADVGAVDVGIGEDADLVVAALVEVELVAEAGTDRRDERLHLVVLEHAVDARPLDVEDLAADGQDRLRRRIAALHRRAPGRVALDDEDLALFAVLRRAVLELVGHAGAVEQRLATDKVARLLGRVTRLGGGDALADDLVGLGRVLLEPVAQLLVGGLLHQRLDRGVAQLGLGLPLELRVAQADRDDRRDALADVLAREVGVLLLELVLRPGVLVDRRGERRLEPLDVGAALDRVDAVGEAVDAVGVVARVPLERDLDLGGRVLVSQVPDLGEQALLRLVDVLDEVDDAAGVLEHDGLGVVAGALVLEPDLEALVEEGHHLEALEDGAGRELDGLEDGVVRPEGDRRALARAGAAVAGSLARDLVALAAELAATVQLGERDLDAGDLVVRVDVGRDAAAVVDDAAAAVGQQRDVDAVAVAGHRLVDGVVDDLPHAVVEAGGAGGADVHAGALAHRLQALEDLHVLGSVRGASLRQGAPFGRGRVPTGGRPALRALRPELLPGQTRNSQRKESTRGGCRSRRWRLCRHRRAVVRRGGRGPPRRRSTRTSMRVMWRSPASSARRPTSCGSRKRTCVVNAGSSHATTSVSPSIDTGRVRAAIASPTTSSQRSNTTSTPAREGEPRRPSTRSIVSPNRTGAGGPPGRGRHAMADSQPSPGGWRRASRRGAGVPAVRPPRGGRRSRRPGGRGRGDFAARPCPALGEQAERRRPARQGIRRGLA